jgi:saccharopine dehydrogenase (NAD+, L-lysine forming)
MRKKIGIRHEDKYLMERRTPLTPAHVKYLSEQGLQFKIQHSPKRVFRDEEFVESGAEISDTLTDCQVILGVKEIPLKAFEPGKTYIFFSHVIKGQAYNMPMLQKMMDLGCNLIDYEKVADDQNRRLIFFGRFAGLAGMINSLWSLGVRWTLKGYPDNPFAGIKQSYRYNSLDEARADVAEAGRKMAAEGIPAELAPLTIGFTGYGNVSRGAQEIADLLPFREITPQELVELKDKPYSSNIIYKTIFYEWHISKPKDQSVLFDLQDYYLNPANYENNFEQYIPHLTVLMNCMYWDSKYPRIFTKSYAKNLLEQGEPKLVVVGDVTCDPDGSIEFTHKGTPIDDPVFVYNPFTDNPSMGFEGDGILVMAVDILPSELPRDASIAFGDALSGFIKPIADADYSLPFDLIELPAPIKKAMILHNGRLTPDYRYICKFLNPAANEATITHSA